MTPLFMIKWKAHSLSCKQKCKNQPMTIPVLNSNNLPFQLTVNNRVASGIGTVMCFRFHWFDFHLIVWLWLLNNIIIIIIIIIFSKRT